MKSPNHKIIKSKHSHGFTLLMAMVISSLLLSLGITVFNVTLKELVLSSYGRNSQFAFYAADTGVECALFWGIKKNAFSTSSPTNIECDGKTIENVGGQSVSIFNINFSPDPFCATVTVDKSGNRTIIESRGYNTCDVSNARRVERGIRVTY
ncbi:MAG: pilus assembly PilX N-terminal domain-containing protein [Candidatus Paceibacterota bacterium]